MLLHGKADARGGFRVSHHAPASGQASLGSAAERLTGDGVPGDGAAGGAARRRQGCERGALAEWRRGALPGQRGRQLDADPRRSCDRRREHLHDVCEALPARTRAQERLPDRASALAAMHFPRDAQDTERGRERLAFDELLLTQLVFLLPPRAAGASTKARARWIRRRS